MAAQSFGHGVSSPSSFVSLGAHIWLRGGLPAGMIVVDPGGGRNSPGQGLIFPLAQIFFLWLIPHCCIKDLEVSLEDACLASDLVTGRGRPGLGLIRAMNMNHSVWNTSVTLRWAILVQWCYHVYICRDAKWHEWVWPACFCEWKMAEQRGTFILA